MPLQIKMNLPCLSCCGSFENVCTGRCDPCPECDKPCGIADFVRIRTEGLRSAVIEYENAVLRIIAQKQSCSVMALKQLHSVAKEIDKASKLRMPKPLVDKVMSFAYGNRCTNATEHNIMAILVRDGGAVEGRWEFNSLLHEGVAYTENEREFDNSFFCGGHLRTDGVVNALWPRTIVKRVSKYLAV